MSYFLFYTYFLLNKFYYFNSPLCNQLIGGENYGYNYIPSSIILLQSFDVIEVSNDYY